MELNELNFIELLFLWFFFIIHSAYETAMSS